MAQTKPKHAAPPAPAVDADLARRLLFDVNTPLWSFFWPWHHPATSD